MTPEALNKLAALVAEGATVVGPRPTHSPSLKGYPECDKDVSTLADKLWGSAEEGKEGTNPSPFERAYGKGRVIWAKSVEDVLREEGVLPDFTCEGGSFDYIHRQTNDADIYFVSNNLDDAVKARCTFRVGGRQPELWDAVTGGNP